MVNPSVCPRIADEGGCGENVGALEIGTGIGVLTQELARRCKKVVAIEIDTSLKPILEETLADFDNVEVIFADVLEADLGAIIAEKFAGLDVVCCANLPYYITSPVLMKLLEEKLPLRCVTVMVQKEAAERIVSPPGTRECGAISVAVRYYCTPVKLFPVSRGSFMPAPKVDSAVIRLDVHPEKPYEVEEKLFFRVVRAIFSQRRKQLANPLSAALGLDKQELQKIMTDCGINPQARAEELDMAALVRLCNKIAEKE